MSERYDWQASRLLAYLTYLPLGLHMYNMYNDGTYACMRATACDMQTAGGRYGFDNTLFYHQ